MSLLEKLNQKKTEKIQREKETEKNGKLQTLEQINAEIATTQTKQQRITALKEALQNNYTGANKKLESFKSQKETLKGAYEENKDILEEEGIENFEGMLEANTQEPEVKQYRRAGGRGPSQEAGAIGISSKYAGETGELYQAVGTLAEMKKSLQAEMSEVKLNFSAVTREGEEISNRENSFIQIDEYLKTLDTEITELNKQKETVYLETPEGKREAILKIDNLEYNTEGISFDKVENFYFKNEVLALAEKIGAEPVKELYKEKVNEKLHKIAWEKKTSNNGNSGKSYYDSNGNYKTNSEEQNAIKTYPALKKLDELSYNYTDLREFNNLHNETLNHLEKILEENENMYNRLNYYGLSQGKSNDYNGKQAAGWSDKRIVAENYVKHAASTSGLGDYDELANILQSNSQKASNKNFTGSSNNNGGIYSPEYIHAKFVQYSKFLEYIKNNTDSNTEFVNRDTENSLMSHLKSDTELREKIGLTEKLPSSTIEIPTEFISKNGNFYDALNKAKKAANAWEDEKNKLTEIGNSAVDSRFAQAWEKYFSEKNKGFLEKVDYNQKITDQLERSLNFLKNTSLSNNPEFANRKIKLSRQASGYTENSIIDDLTATEDYNRVIKEGQEIDKKIENYATEKKTEIEKAMGELKRKMIAFGREDKLKALDKKWQTFENFRKNQLLKEDTLKKDEISDEEIATMKSYRQEKTANDEAYRKQDRARIDFREATNKTNLFIDFKSKVDVLDGQQTTLAELPNLLATRLAEARSEKASLSESKLVIIIEERDRAVADVKTSTDKFQRTAVANAEVLRKYRA